jgi:hypothetical protein
MRENDSVLVIASLSLSRIFVAFSVALAGDGNSTIAKIGSCNLVNMLPQRALFLFGEIFQCAEVGVPLLTRRSIWQSSSKLVAPLNSVAAHGDAFIRFVMLRESSLIIWFVVQDLIYIHIMPIMPLLA